MIRNRLRPAIALAGLFVPLALTACGDKGVSIGSNSAELRSVDPAAVSGSVPACATQTAHPNVCCKGGPGQDSACVAYVNSPFHKCDDGFALYPDPSQCCDLNNPSSCVAPPPLPPVPVPTTCAYACAPGWWPVVNNPGECCQMVPGQNALQCTQIAWAYPTQPMTGCAIAVSGSEDGGVAVSDGGTVSPSDGGGIPVQVDGGVVDDGGVIPIPGPGPIPDCDAGAPPPPMPPWPSPVCNTICPAGFAPLAADPSTCCSPQPNGTEICFSQAVGPVGPPTPVPGGTGGGSLPPSPGGTGGSAPPGNGK